MEIKEYPSLVIAGIWNLSILTPEWYAKMFPDFVDQAKEFRAKIQIGTGALKFDIKNITINPAPDKLILFSKKTDDNDYELIEKLAIGTVSKLPHTPIRALGHNISYSIGDKDFIWFNADKLGEFEDFYKKELGTSAFNSQKIKHKLSYENHDLNLTYDVKRQEKIISFNYNYEITDPEKINVYISEFRNNITNSLEITKKLSID